MTDLAAATVLQPPEVISIWDDVAQPAEWIPVTSNIVPLGSGKMFTAKLVYNDKIITARAHEFVAEYWPGL